MFRYRNNIVIIVLNYYTLYTRVCRRLRLTNVYDIGVYKIIHVPRFQLCMCAASFDIII